MNTMKYLWYDNKQRKYTKKEFFDKVFCIYKNLYNIKKLSKMDH